MSLKPTILIIEDSKAVQAAYAESLQDRAVVLPAYTHQEAIIAFNSNQHIDGIIVDGMVPTATEGSLAEPVSTVGVISFICKLGFTGPIMAITASPILQQPMLEAGATSFHLKDEKGLLATIRAMIDGL